MGQGWVWSQPNLYVLLRAQGKISMKGTQGTLWQTFMFYNLFEGPPSLVFERGATGYPWVRVRGSQKIALLYTQFQ